MDKIKLLYDDQVEENETSGIEDKNMNLLNESNVELIQETNTVYTQNIKIRNIPHIEGNFACSIYLKVKKSNKIISYKDKLFDKFKNIIEKKNNLDFENFEVNCDEYHISISRTFYMKFHQLNNLLKGLINSINNNIKIKGPISLFLLKKINFFQNDQNTRFFVGLEILKSKKLIMFVDFINEFLKQYNINSYYEVNKFLFYLK